MSRLNSLRLSNLSPTIALCAVLVALASAAHAQPTSRQSSKAALQQVKYGGMTAYRLSDGRSEAVIVPTLGRVMRYGLVGKANLLWNSASSETDTGTWRNWGGDKSWPAPQSQWPLSIGRRIPRGMGRAIPLKYCPPDVCVPPVESGPA